MKYILHVVLIVFSLGSLISAQSTYVAVKPIANSKLTVTQNNQESRQKATQANEPIDPPFFEDFYDNSHVPNQEKWIDNYAFINTNYPINPISIGVATLDAIDENGDLYATTDDIYVSDYLTSRYINLGTYEGDEVYFSFFYQPGGNGELPESKDSLVLEFYQPTLDSWFYVWSISADSLAEFQQVIIAVQDTFIADSFQFRFYNYTSLSVKDIPGANPGSLSNADLWHIDYIKLDNNTLQSHEQINDLGFVQPMSSILVNYNSIPWSHFEASIFTGRNNVIEHYIRNSYEVQGSRDRFYIVKNLESGAQISPFAEPQGEIYEASTINQFEDYLDPQITYDEEPLGRYKIGCYFNMNPGEYPGNDTIWSIYNFLNYYAYDDGTAEFGFGLKGEAVQNGFLAKKFNTYMEDQLVAVDICFNKTRNNYNASVPFKIFVWDDISPEQDNLDSPNNILYAEGEDDEERYPDSTYGFNSFKRYYLHDTIDVGKIFYVGWQQLSNDFINVGYDLNNKHRDKIYYNVTGNWVVPTSSLDGSLMIRPVFVSDIIVHNKHQKNNLDFIIYPNPASDYLFIEPNYQNKTSDYLITILDISGRKLTQQKYNHQLTINHLKNGMYIIQISDGKSIFSKKFIVSK